MTYYTKYIKPVIANLDLDAMTAHVASSKDPEHEPFNILLKQIKYFKNNPMFKILSQKEAEAKIREFYLHLFWFYDRQLSDRKLRTHTSTKAKVDIPLVFESSLKISTPTEDSPRKDAYVTLYADGAVYKEPLPKKYRGILGQKLTGGTERDIGIHTGGEETYSDYRYTDHLWLVPARGTNIFPTLRELDIYNIQSGDLDWVLKQFTELAKKVRFRNPKQENNPASHGAEELAQELALNMTKANRFARAAAGFKASKESATRKIDSLQDKISNIEKSISEQEVKAHTALYTTLHNDIQNASIDDLEQLQTQIAKLITAKQELNQAKQNLTQELANLPQNKQKVLARIKEDLDKYHK